jgi:hypothetical protein
MISKDHLFYVQNDGQMTQEKLLTLTVWDSILQRFKPLERKLGSENLILNVQLLLNDIPPLSV